MNKERRKRLEAIVGKLEELKGEFEEISSDEELYRDNIPENLQGSERYERADEICDNLTDALFNLEEAIESINFACE